MIFLQGLSEALEPAGVPIARLLHGSALEGMALDAVDARVPRAEFFRLWELAMELTGDPALSLHCAEKVEARTTVSHLVAHASCLGQALESLLHYEHLLSDDPILQRSDGEHSTTIRVLPLAGQSPLVRRFWAELFMAALFRLVRRFDYRAQPDSMTFEFPAPPYYPEYTRIFGSSVSFEQRHTEIVIDRALLTAPAPERDDELYKAMREIAERRSMRLAHNTLYAIRVRQFLLQQAQPYRVEMQTVASGLDLSVRSLRRRLAIEGRSYSAIVNETLATIAKALLTNARYTIQEIAYELGFSDATAFHHAFRRWTATTPSAYRRELLR
jgi:AraC-like DNA-binding protein